LIGSFAFHFTIPPLKFKVSAGRQGDRYENHPNVYLLRIG
jgi:hypothetical protein